MSFYTRKGNQTYREGSMPLHYPSDRVTYDNTESGLSATDTQGAIDEIVSEGKWSALITLNSKVSYMYNNHFLIVVPTGAETMTPWSSVTLGTLPSNIFTIKKRVEQFGIIDGSDYSFKRGNFSVDIDYAVKINSWEDSLSTNQVPIGNHNIIVPIELK